MTKTPAVTALPTQVVVYQSRSGERIQLSMDIVRDFLVSGKKELVDDREIVLYMGICKALQMNPFAKDCYLVKYDTNPAAIITAIDFYRARARAQEDCKGWGKGVICLQKDGTLRYSNGLVLPGETLVGGWFEGQPEGWTVPYKLEVNLDGYAKDNAFWKGPKAATMIAKVAESQGLRTLWPNEFKGTITAEEIGELSEAMGGGELFALPPAGTSGAKSAAKEPPDTSKFFSLVDAKLKEMSPERQEAVAAHLKAFLEENAELRSKKKKGVVVTPEDLMVPAAEFFHPYVNAEEKHEPGFWKRFLAWEENPDRPWNQKAHPHGIFGDCMEHGRFEGDECPKCAAARPTVAPGAEGGPAEKAEAEAAAGDNAGEPGEETFEARVERLWGLVMKKAPPTKAMKEACGVTMRNTITPENIDAFEKFITEYEKK